MIFGPKADCIYVIEFRTAKGEVRAISIAQDRSPGDLAFPALRASLERAAKP
jgi:hypothetical protein